MTNKSMGGHESPVAQTTTWLTPLEIIRALGDFDLDPCGYPNWPTAERLICLPDDGLAADWQGRVWLNPPYGAAVWTWLDKLANHGDGVALIFARTETAGFVRQVWQRADAVKFLHGRLNFHRPNGERGQANAGAPSCLVAYGEGNVRALYDSPIAGTTVRLTPERSAA